MDHAAPPLPASLANELHGEPVVFAVRERRAISRRTLARYVGAGVILVAVSFIAEARGLSDVTRYGFLVAGVGWLALAGVAWTIPGGTVVGTSTRLLRTRSFDVGLQVASWRELRGAAAGADGSVEIERFGRRPSLLLPDDIAQPDPGDGLAARIAALLQAPVAEARASRAKLPEYRFRSTHTPPKRSWLPAQMMGGFIVVIGAWIVGILVFALVRARSTEEELFLVPFLVGPALMAVGLALVRAGGARRRPVEYVAAAAGLELGKGKEKRRIPWEEFEGTYVRARRWGREELRFPLRRMVPSPWRKGAVEPEVVRIVGVAQPDEVAAALMRRIQA